MNGLNSFHAFGFLLAVLVSVIMSKLDGQGRIDYKKLVLYILTATAVITAAGLVGATDIFQNSLLLKALVYVIIPSAGWVVYRFRPKYFRQNSKTVIASICYILLTIFSLAVAK